MDATVQVVTLDDGAFDGYLYFPKVLPAPGIVMIPEIFGVNQPLREIARRYAEEGYVVLALDIFWRLERNIDLSYDETGYTKAFDYYAAFDYDTCVSDMQAGINLLRARPECSGAVGVVGFCLGGTMAYLAAARCDVDAAAGYYGTRIQNFLDDAPHIERPLILHFGEIDHTTPPDIMAQILPAIAPNPHVVHYVYKQAGHAFANHRREDTYREDATRAADHRTFALFEKQLSIDK